MKAQAPITFKTDPADPKWLANLDDWRRKQTPIPSRSKAIRDLVTEGIKASKGKK